MTALPLLVLTALTAMVRGGDSLPPEDQTRYEQIATTMAEIAESDPLWPDETGQAATALALAAIAQHESGLREEVRHCRVTGEAGRVVGLYQIRKGWTWDGNTKGDICASDSLQAQLALRVLHHYTETCRRCGLRFAFNGYASGDGGHPSKESRQIEAIWVKMAAKVGLQVFPTASTSPRWKG